MQELAHIPKVPLAQLPTTVELLTRTSKRLGAEVWVKRDDLTGGAVGGNKARKLEYLVAAARRADADTLITCGAAQSNHARATAAVAATCGFRCRLLLHGDRAPVASGNLFLDELFGAVIDSCTRAEYQDRDAIMRRMADDERRAGRRPYLIVEGGSDATGSIGYAAAAFEIAADEQRLGFRFDHIVFATGSGGTLAGLLAGAELAGLRAKIRAVAVCDDAAYFTAVADRILGAMRTLFLPNLGAHAGQAAILDGFKGLGYGRSTVEELDLWRRMARESGLVLDPVYTLKAWRGLEAQIATGAVERGSRVLFLQTAGIAAALAHADAAPAPCR